MPFVFGQQRRVEVDRAKVGMPQEFITQLAPVKKGRNAPNRISDGLLALLPKPYRRCTRQAQFPARRQNSRALQMAVGQDTDDFDMVLFGQNEAQVGGNLFTTHK